jgi:hypothetical protein
MQPKRVPQTIAGLREAGYRVNVRHWRRAQQLYVDEYRDATYYKLLDGLYLARTIREWGPRYVAAPHGGAVEVSITAPDGAVYGGRSECSDKDQFVATVGTAIALGRAFAAMEFDHRLEQTG